MSDKKCCVPGCANSRGSKNALHKFPNPAKDKERFNTWVYAVGGEILNLKNDFVFKHRRVCRRHFQPKFWCRSNRLSNIAIPTDNLAGISSEKFKFTEHHFKTIQNIMTSEATTSKDDASHCLPLEEEPHRDQPPEESVHSWQRDADDRSPLEELHEEQPLEEECIYSWEKHDAEVPCDADVAVIAEEGRRSPSMPRTIGATESAHLNVRCNVCENEIFGFRYVCVQCPDYDLCSACEARRAHSAHYVLRVPGPRPESELQQLLRAIRQALAASILQLQDQAQVEVKEEVEDPLLEAPGAPFQPAGPPEDHSEHCSTADELHTHRPDDQLRTDDEGGTSFYGQDDEIDYSCLYKESELPVDPEEITQPQKNIVMPRQIQDCNRPITKHLCMVRQYKEAVKRTHPFSEEPAAKTRVWDTPPAPPGPSTLGLPQPGPLQPGPVQPILKLLGPVPPGPVQPILKLLRPSPPGSEQPGQLLKVYNPLGISTQPRKAYVALRRLQLPPSASNEYSIEKIS